MNPLSLAVADRTAAKIVQELAPFCDQVEIAGSIRRRRPFVNDIDLVVLPKPNKLEALRHRCRRNAIGVQADGDCALIVQLHGIQLDLWIARPPTSDMFDPKPTNFGSLLLMRTGSKAHNIRLIERAKELGLRWNPYHGVFDGHGKCLACATEQEIFDALRLDFVAPEAREV